MISPRSMKSGASSRTVWTIILSCGTGAADTMRLSEIGGEFGFIERIRGPHAAPKGHGLVVPVGDDGAVVDVPAGRQVVVTTDMLVENIHFRREWSDPYSIGWKAAAANLSGSGRHGGRADVPVRRAGRLRAGQRGGSGAAVWTASPTA